MTTKIIERPTLVLNRNWQPVGVAPVARALVMVWNDSAQVVGVDDFRLFSWADWAKLVPGEDEPYVQAVRFRLRVPEVILAKALRSRADQCRHFQPQKPLQAGPLHLPVLRRAARHGGVDDRSSSAPFPGRHDFLGELRAGLRDLQQAEGGPHARAGPDDAPQAACPAGLETDLRRSRHENRQLDEVPQRGLLERGASGLSAAGEPVPVGWDQLA